MVKLMNILMGLMIVACLSFAGWYLFYNLNDKVQVDRRVDKMEELMRVKGDEGNIGEVIRTQQLSAIPADEMLVEGVSPLVDGQYSSVNFASTVLKFRKMASKLEVDFSHRNVEVISEDSAVVSTEATVTATVKSSDEVIKESCDAFLYFKKINGEWKLTKVSGRPALI